MKHVKTLAGVLAATALVATPVAATPANPAASLSVARSLRAASPTRHDARLGGGVFWIAAAAIFVIATVVILASDDSSDSN